MAVVSIKCVIYPDSHWTKQYVRNWKETFKQYSPLLIFKHTANTIPLKYLPNKTNSLQRSFFPLYFFKCTLKQICKINKENLQETFHSSPTKKLSWISHSGLGGFWILFPSLVLIVSGGVPEQRDSRQEMRRLEAASGGELGSVG